MVDRFCFRPVNRLHQASEFSEVFQYRRVIRGKFFDLHWRLQSAVVDSESSSRAARLGLVVPKRLARRAVMRNLMKRIARESFRQQLEFLPTVDLVLKLARKPGSKAGADLATPHPSNPVFRRELAEEIGGLFRTLSSRFGIKLPSSEPDPSSKSLT